MSCVTFISSETVGLRITRRRFHVRGLSSVKYPEAPTQFKAGRQENRRKGASIVHAHGPCRANEEAAKREHGYRGGK